MKNTRLLTNLHQLVKLIFAMGCIGLGLQLILALTPLPNLDSDFTPNFKLIPFWLLMSISLAAMWQILRLLHSLKTNPPFIHQNYLYLKRFAWILFAYPISKALLAFFTDPSGFNALPSYYSPKFAALIGSLIMSLPAIILALTALVIADVFRAGIEIKEDQDLTV